MVWKEYQNKISKTTNVRKVVQRMTTMALWPKWSRLKVPVELVLFQEECQERLFALVLLLLGLHGPQQEQAYPELQVHLQ
jgi:hypothetical protein